LTVAGDGGDGEVVASALAGYNACLLAYGQTGTGKTYTMEGFHHGNAEERGIIPRAIEQIFSHIETHANDHDHFLVRVSYLQLYKECVNDLLAVPPPNDGGGGGGEVEGSEDLPRMASLPIREDKRRGVFVEALSEWVVRNPAEVYGLMSRGAAARASASTKLSELSSRSHALCQVIVEQSSTSYVNPASGREISPEDAVLGAGAGAGEKDRAFGVCKMAAELSLREKFKVSKLNLVDLAGSERVRDSGATGQRLEECKKINQSLSALGNVILALARPGGGRTHVPYRDSKLTRLLEDSLGGNCRTTMLATVSPCVSARSETLSTLRFALRASRVRTGVEATVNEDWDNKSLLRKYERELARLRAELEARSRSVVDQRRLLELEEMRRRAEADKMAAIAALEARSLEFLQEKAEKRRLEAQIESLTSQVIRGETAAMARNTQATPVEATPVEATPVKATMTTDSEVGEEGTEAGAGRIMTDKDGALSVRLAREEQEALVRQEYASRLAALEKRARKGAEQEKAVIALTRRLHEREEQIAALQKEEKKGEEEACASFTLQLGQQEQAEWRQRRQQAPEALKWDQAASASASASASAPASTSKGNLKSKEQTQTEKKEEDEDVACTLFTWR